MSDVIPEIPEDGFVMVTIGGVSKRLDLYEAFNRILEAAEGTEGQPKYEFHRKLVEVVQSLGFPECSTRAAAKFYESLSGRIAELGKADAGEPTLDSPTTTAPEPSISPPASN